MPSLTVVLDTPNISAMTRSAGNRSPGARRPSSSMPRIWVTIASEIGFLPTR